jgi:FG-GAP-like repeat
MTSFGSSIRWSLFGLLLVALPGACGSTRSTPANGSGSSGGGAADGGASTSNAGGEESAAALIDLGIEVVRSSRARGWVAAKGARALAQGIQGSTEAVTDERGRARLLVEPGSGPWDVTVALENHSAVSILNLDGPLAGRVHLWARGNAVEADVVERALAVTVLGRSSASSLLAMRGQGLLSSASGDSNALVSSRFLDYEGATPLRLLVTEETAETDWLPLNAAWLVAPRTGTDLTAEIRLPASRRVRTTKMVLETPQEGAVIGRGMKAERHEAHRWQDDYSFRVGASWLDPEPDAEGRFDWHVAAFEDDMAPSYATIELAHDVEHEMLLARAPVSEGAVVSIHPAQALDATGSDVNALSLTWLAPGHSHIGASLQGDGSWYVYGAASDQTLTHAWPRLPDGFSLADLGFSADTNLVVNVFAITQPVGSTPWDWTKPTERTAVVRTFGVSAELPPGNESGAGGVGGVGAAGEPGVAAGAPSGGAGAAAGAGGAGGAADAEACAGPLAFSNARTLAIGGDLRAVVAADFDSDGRPDLAVSSGYDDTVSILRNEGDGAFASPEGYDGGYFPAGLAVADVNQDAKLDLVVANFGETVSVLMNDGAGVFMAPVSYDAGQHPTAVVAVDFNGDDAPDIAAINLSSNDVSVLLNQGDGTFDAAVHYDGGNTPGSLTAADFDGDGALDLVVAGEDYVRVLSGSGHGTFTSIDYTIAGYGQGVTAADVDADGDTDIALATSGNLVILSNLGDGTFAAPRYYLAGLGPRAIAPADFDRDGLIDFSVANLGVGDADVALVRNQGGGEFAPLDFATGMGSGISVANADFDGDGDSDVAVANFISGNVRLVINHCVP